MLVAITVSASSQPNFERWGTNVPEVTPLKEWTITFNQSIKKDTINNATIYIKDEKGNLVDAHLNTLKDKKVVVIPKEVFTTGEEYTLYISNDIRSERRNRVLENYYKMPFSIKKVNEVKTEGNYQVNQVTSFSSELTLSGIFAEVTYFNVLRLGIPLSDKKISVNGSLVSLPSMFTNTDVLQVRFYNDEGEAIASGTFGEDSKLQITHYKGN